MSGIQDLFTHRIIIKMLHWQTTSYAIHASTDLYLTTFDLNFDRFAEVYQGRYGDFVADTVAVTAMLVDEDTVDEYLSRFSGFLETLTHNSAHLPIELASIRDDMLAEAQKLRYLLRKA